MDLADRISSNEFLDKYIKYHQKTGVPLPSNATSFELLELAIQKPPKILNNAEKLVFYQKLIVIIPMVEEFCQMCLKVPAKVTSFDDLKKDDLILGPKFETLFRVLAVLFPELL